MSRYTLGVDTSNYATSLAVFDTAGEVVCAKKRFLPVKAGQLGLRQSDALFHHTAALPEMLQELAQEFDLTKIDAVGVSQKPRPVEGSYMPCFLAGVSAATAFAAARDIPLIYTTHQQGHAAAALYAAKGEALFSQNGIAGFVFYGYIILFLIGMFMPKMLPFNPGSKPLMILFIGVPVVLFFLKEPLNGLMKGEGLTPHQGWGNFALEEVFEVLEIILSFVTNSLSYLRVGGFVLSHAGMMLVVMTLVKMTGNAGPVVFVLGNLFVMGLEGLIVGIQTLRLEYYEMFSRYFVGNGKKFTMISSENA